LATHRGQHQRRIPRVEPPPLRVFELAAHYAHHPK
jgi:hypothetical protein